MAKTTTIAGNTFLFTGKLIEFTREDAEAHVEAEGGKVLSGVSAKLNYLVVGEDAGSKLKKAEALGTVTILHEKEFLKMMSFGKTPTKVDPKNIAKSNTSQKSKKEIELTDSKKAVKKEVVSKGVQQEVLFARNSSTNLSNCHGMEIAIGKLDSEDLTKISALVEDDMYLESDYFSNWYQWENVCHENGVFMNGCDVEDLDDKNDLTSPNIEIGDVIFNDVIINKKGAYLCTFRNETIYMVSKATTRGNGMKKVDCHVSQFSFMNELADVDISILKSTLLEGEEMTRDSSDEEDSGEIYDTYQFLILDNKIIFCATNGSGQEPFYFDDNFPILDTENINKKDILNSLKIYLPKIAKGKDVEIEKAIRKVSANGEQLKNLDDKLKSNKEVVLAAVKQNERAFLYASENLKLDKEFILEAVKLNGAALSYIADNYKGDKEIVLAAVKQNGMVLNYATDKLKNDKEVVLTAVNKRGDALYYASDKLKDDKEIVLAAVKSNSHSLDDASERLKDDKEIVLAAVMFGAYALDYASDRLKNDKEIVLAAVKQDGESLKFASKKLQADTDIIKAAKSQINN